MPIPANITLRHSLKNLKPASAAYFWLTLGLFFLLLGGCAGEQESQVIFLNEQEWRARIVLPSSLDIQAAQALPGVRAALEETGMGQVLSLAGEGGAEQLRSLIYADLAEQLHPLSPGNVLILGGDVRQGEQLTFRLESSLTSGFSWEVEQADLLQLEQVVFSAAGSVPGAPLQQALTFTATGNGSASLRLKYRRPWERDIQSQGELSIQAAELDFLTDLTNPNHAEPVQNEEPAQRLPGLEGDLQLNLQPLQAAAAPAAGTLPAAFDWRSLGKVPPVRDQGSCGSCWAFATTGVLESAIMIQDNLTEIDLSEQYLVSCNTSKYSCSGGWTAHSYHQDTLGINQAEAGAVLEAQFPYQGIDLPCEANYSHHFRLNTWSYITNTVPLDVQAIKQAIYTYGPVKASVCTGPAFSRYENGVFSTDESSLCGGRGVNHGVILVGWDDSQGVWILRNSWGSVWGEAGYMRIAYNTSNVGSYANFVVYNSSRSDRVYLPMVKN